MGKERRLGRGLDSLLSTNVADVSLEGMPAGDILQLRIDDIRPNPFQPRDSVGGEAFEELVASVREHGVLQPVLVRRAGEGYELIAGERRWRACKQVGLDAVPAMVRDIGDDDALTLALVENLQREDLNPIEKARAFREMADRFDLTQEEVARRTGKERPTIANFLRLLDLPEAVQELVSRGTISMGHARALLGLDKAKEQMDMCRRIIRDDLSVRDVERVVTRGKRPRGPRRAAAVRKNAHLRDLEDRMRERVGLKVTVEARGARGKVSFHFANDADLQQLLDVLGI